MLFLQVEASNTVQHDCAQRLYACRCDHAAILKTSVQVTLIGMLKPAVLHRCLEDGQSAIADHRGTFLCAGSRCVRVALAATLPT